MKKRIRICKNRLEISQETYGSPYMVHNSKLDLFVHVDNFKLGQHDNKKGWLMFYNADNTYIGSVWIRNDTDMKKVKQFLEETK